MSRAGRIRTLLIGGIAATAVADAAEAPPEAVSVVERFHAALAAGDRAQVLAALDPGNAGMREQIFRGSRFSFPSSSTINGYP